VGSYRPNFGGDNNNNNNDDDDSYLRLGEHGALRSPGWYEVINFLYD